MSLVSDGRTRRSRQGGARLSQNGPPTIRCRFICWQPLPSPAKTVQRGRQDLEEALKLDPNFSPAALSLAVLDLKAGRKAEAKQRYEEVTSRTPKSVPGHAWFGAACLEERDIKTA